MTNEINRIDVLSAYGYTRLSQNSRRSIEDQKADIDGYCASSTRLELIDICNEGRYQSGFGHEQREEYLRLKELVESGVVDAVVVRGTERLGRDFNERMRFVIHLREHGVELHDTERGRVEIEDEYAAGVEGIHAASDDAGKRKEIERLKTALLRKRARGEATGEPPMGAQYTDDKTAFRPGDDFQHVRNLIDDKTGEDKLTHREAAKKYEVATGTITKILKRRHIYDAIDETGTWRPSDESDWRPDPGVIAELKDRDVDVSEYIGEVPASTID